MDVYMQHQTDDVYSVKLLLGDPLVDWGQQALTFFVKALILPPKQ